MSVKAKSSKKQRNKPCKPRGVASKGIGGAKRHRLDQITKTQLGKGLFRSFAPIGSVKH